MHFRYRSGVEGVWSQSNGDGNANGAGKTKLPSTWALLKSVRQAS